MSEKVTLDTSHVDKWVGVPLGGGQLKEPIHINDIRRWAQGMQNPNPLFYDERYAAESRFGELLAPQSFTVCTTIGHGATPAIQGNIPGTHMLFGGDEWWCFGPAIRPDDLIRSERMLFDYVVKETKFAGPTMFSRGDTTYINQKGEIIARQRSTSIRYLVEEALKRAAFSETKDPEWTDEQLAELEEKKMDYYRSFLDLGHEKRLFVKVGDKLPTQLIGPHTIMSFTTEWRSYLMTVWGSSYEEGKSSTMGAGWIPEMSRDEEGAKVDPSNADGLYKGPSRGHVQPRFARLIGMPRGYGYGASMGAWILDYLTNWGGEHCFVLHSSFQYRAPALTGDVTFLRGEVLSVDPDPRSGVPVATVKAVMTNQDDAVMATGQAEIQLPQP